MSESAQEQTQVEQMAVEESAPAAPAAAAPDQTPVAATEPAVAAGSPIFHFYIIHTPLNNDTRSIFLLLEGYNAQNLSNNTIYKSKMSPQSDLNSISSR